MSQPSFPGMTGPPQQSPGSGDFGQGQPFDWSALYARNKAVTFELIPAGDYSAECTSAEAVRASTGTPMIVMKLRIFEGSFAGRVLMFNQTLSIENDTALMFFFKTMAAFGLDQNFFSGLPGGQLAPVAQTLVGRKVTIGVTHETWEGEKRAKVKRIKPLTAGLPGASGLPGLPGMPTPDQHQTYTAVPQTLAQQPVAPPVAYQTPQVQHLPHPPSPPQPAPPQPSQPSQPAPPQPTPPQPVEIIQAELPI